MTTTGWTELDFTLWWSWSHRWVSPTPLHWDSLAAQTLKPELPWACMACKGVCVGGGGDVCGGQLLVKLVSPAPCSQRRLPSIPATLSGSTGSPRYTKEPLRFTVNSKLQCCFQVLQGRGRRDQGESRKGKGRKEMTMLQSRTDGAGRQQVQH